MANTTNTQRSATTKSQRASTKSPAQSGRHRRVGDSLLRFSEACEILPISPQSVRYMRLQGYGPPFFKLGGRHLVIWQSDLYAWIEEQASADAEQQAAR